MNQIRPIFNKQFEGPESGAMFANLYQVLRDGRWIATLSVTGTDQAVLSGRLTQQELALAVKIVRKWHRRVQ